ncbi:hypothetical protein [Peterkaempfera bronchialis]|uniref:Uncharacterized protein n=1 Tax=Peterkaempfera bronchialis TaxID=2126346 RepID=A0A345SR73_9ACTN|nr:hypothetical protein [Peterkaempfera bronchialis]AXI76228.1 hypothetical protein C7M71_000800 [Peterkaempfera bronchialis]
MNLRPRRPQRPPSETDLAERDRFRALVRESLPGVRASAEVWRNGLAAFITLLGAAIVVKGRTTTAELPIGWRLAVTVLVGGGLALAVVGLWHALAAQAGASPLAVTLADIHRDHGSVDAFEVATAIRAARRLTLARRTVALALASLFIGTALTWWAPSEQPGSIRVTHGTDTTCGTLLSADGGTLRVSAEGRADPVVIPLTDIRDMVVTADCS